MQPLKMSLRGFPGSPVVDSPLSLQKARVQSLVGELRPYKPKKKKKSLIFFFLINIFIYLFLAALGLCCCEQGLLFVAVQGLLIAVASLVAEHGL